MKHFYPWIILLLAWLGLIVFLCIPTPGTATLLTVFSVLLAAAPKPPAPTTIEIWESLR